MNMQIIDASKETTHLAEIEKALQTTKTRQVEANAQDPAARQTAQKGDEEGGAAEQQNQEQVLSQAQDYFRQRGVDLHFKVLDETGALQVEMTDSGSKRVIRKIPGDEIVKLSDNLKRMAKGVMDKEV